MFLVAGLGNPGPKYAGNRHNAGFMVIEELARRACVLLSASRFEGRMARARIGPVEAVLLEPMTYMNRSGGPVAAAARFFKVDPETELVVVHDELDLELGTIRVKQGGGTAGHKGLRSIAAGLGATSFLRVRFGIGRPKDERSVTAHVLSDFSPEEARELPTIIDRGADAVEILVAEGPAAAMNKLHGVKTP